MEASPLRTFLFRAEAALLAADLPRSRVLIPSDVELGEHRADCNAVVRLLRPARCGDVAALLADPWFEPIAAVLSRASVDETLATRGLESLLEDVRSKCREFLRGGGGQDASALREVGLLLLGVASLQLYSRATWTGPPLNEDECAGLPFDASTGTSAAPAFLEALEVDGEPAYELITGAGFLWLSVSLLGIIPPKGKAAADPQPALAGGQTLPVWQSRCAFAWQLSIAEASERGMGQSPWLFRASVCEMVGSDERPGALSGVGLLEGETLGAVRALTAPVLKAIDGRSSASSQPPWVIAAQRDPEALAPSVVVPPDGDRPSLLSALPQAVRATLIVEFSVRLCWYGRAKVFEQVLAAACETLGVNYKVTGVLGIKRKYQTVEFAQMAVKFWALSPGEAVPNAQKAAEQEPKAEENPNDADAGNDVEDAALEQAPGNLKLSEVDDMTDILERTKLSSTLNEEERLQFERPLAAVEQLLMLARCSYLWATSNPNDEMVLQEVNACATRTVATEEKPIDVGAAPDTILEEDEGAEEEEEAALDAAQAKADGPLYTANWLNFSCGLFYRCRAEHHRNKTRERAAFQLQSLVDQYSDQKPSAAHRLLFVHAAGYPARFHLQRELGTRMMRMGMVSTAHEQFKKLKMWPEAVDCLMVADRNCEAIDMVKELLEHAATPRLWCCLGDLEREPKHYETAWELSKHRFARAQRSLGKGYFDKGDLPKAIDAFRASLEINPLHAGIWFTLGVAEMRLERWDSALLTFARCVGIEDEHSEAWANLAAVHSALGNLKEARTCMYEATKRARQNWRMWESFLGICLQLRDVRGAIQALRRFVELEQPGRIQERVLGLLTMSVVTDRDGLYEGQTGKAFVKPLGDFFKLLTASHASVPFFWRFYAEFQESQGRPVEALESRFRQARATQARLWEEADPDRFANGLEDLCECFETLDDVLAESSMADEAKKRLQSFCYSVRNAEKQLKQKIESAVQEPEVWRKSLAMLQQMAPRLEARAAAIGAAPAVQEEQ